jgi:hypothetical protein
MIALRRVCGASCCFWIKCEREGRSMKGVCLAAVCRLFASVEQNAKRSKLEKSSNFKRPFCVLDRLFPKFWGVPNRSCDQSNYDSPNAFIPFISVSRHCGRPDQPWSHPHPHHPRLPRPRLRLRLLPLPHAPPHRPFPAAPAAALAQTPAPTTTPPPISIASRTACCRWPTSFASCATSCRRRARWPKRRKKSCKNA